MQIVVGGKHEMHKFCGGQKLRLRYVNVSSASRYVYFHWSITLRSFFNARNLNYFSSVIVCLLMIARLNAFFFVYRFAVVLVTFKDNSNFSSANILFFTFRQYDVYEMIRNLNHARVGDTCAKR